MFDYYEDKSNADELENIFLDYKRTKRECDFVSHRLFEYYKTRNDYENGANRKSYITAMKYFKKAKAIYLKIKKDESRWERKLAEIKERYKKRKAFLEEAKVLD